MKYWFSGLLAILILTSAVNAQITEKHSGPGSLVSIFDNTTGKVAYLCAIGGADKGSIIIDAVTYQTVMTISDPEFFAATEIIPDINQCGSDEIIVTYISKATKQSYVRILKIKDQSVVMEWKDPNISYYPYTYVNKNNKFCLKVLGYDPNTLAASYTIYDLGITVSASATTVSGNADEPANYSLHQNYPNPFNPSTTIGYNVSKAGPVKLYIYDMAGNLVKTFEQDHSQAGSYQYSWNGTNIQGERVSSGMYIYELETGAYKEARKMIMLK